MAYYPPRPRPTGRPKSIARIARESYPDMTEERAQDISHTIHKRMREAAQKRGKK
jgi:hypothetical protein